MEEKGGKTKKRYGQKLDNPRYGLEPDNQLFSRKFQDRIPIDAASKIPGKESGQKVDN